MSIISKSIENRVLVLEGIKRMNQSDTQSNPVKAAPSWVIAFLLISELGIVIFFALIYSGKTSPLIKFDESTIPTFAVLLVAVLTVASLYLSWRKLKRISSQILTAFRNQGLNILASRETIFSKFEGTYKGLRCRISFGLGNDDTPDYYVVNFFHERKLNLRFLCTNILSNQTGKLPKLPLLKPLGSSQIELPNLTAIRCWAGDKLLGQNLLSDNQVQSSLVALSESVNKISGRFIIDDSGLRLAFAAEVIPEQSLLDLAYNICLGLGRSNILPVRPISPAFKVKAIRTLILAGICIFMAIFILTIFYGR
jgi:hypothetical protein